MSKTVLVFDSGVGGLSIYEPIRQQLPELNFLYAFDNACFPYGELSESRLVERCCQVITAVLARHPVDLVVIACNTASTHVLPTLRPMLSIPVVGVVPAIKPAASATRNGCIGLLATPGTIARPYTQRLIQEFAAHHRVLLCGTTELVVQAERKLMGLEVELPVLTEVLAPWQQGEQKPDTLVLGCTHFPLLKQEIAALLPDVALVDSGAAVAQRVCHLLGAQSVSSQKKISRAYCTRDDDKAARLRPTLQAYGFDSLTCLAVS